MHDSKNLLLVRIVFVLTKVASVLLLLILLFVVVSVIATAVSPSPILLRTPNKQLTLRTSGLDVIFRFEQAKQPSHAVTSAFLSALPITACNIVVLFQLRKILSTVLEGNPFVAENARRLRYIAFALFAIAILSTLTGALTGRWQQEMIQLPGVQTVVRWRFDPGQIGVGVLILVLAEVFRQGVAMKEEQDLTI